ncbi:MAG: hypothetical protein EBR82_82305 [Caulobacteraceae bacterium]|nr:hypothetical protein [Caulobacteraceae bacterium]
MLLPLAERLVQLGFSMNLITDGATTFWRVVYND